MELIVFEMAVIGRRADGGLILALLDGVEEKHGPHKCVALLSCRPEAAKGLCDAVSAALSRP